MNKYIDMYFFINVCIRLFIYSSFWHSSYLSSCKIAASLAAQNTKQHIANRSAQNYCIKPRGGGILLVNKKGRTESTY